MYRNIHKYIHTNSEILNKNKFQLCILTGGEIKHRSEKNFARTLAAVYEENVQNNRIR